MPAKSPNIQFNRTQARYEHPLGRQDGKWFTLFKEFIRLPAETQAVTTDLDFDLVGTGTQVAPTFLAPSNRYGGGINVATRATSAADNDETMIFPLAISRWGSAIVPASNNRQVVEAVIRTSSAITTRAIVFGWKLTNAFGATISTDANQALFVYDTDNSTSATQWLALSSNSNTDTYTASGVTVATSTDYKLAVSIDGDLLARFYINDRLVATSAAHTTANYLPAFGVIQRADVPGGVAVDAGIRYIKVSRYIA